MSTPLKQNIRVYMASGQLLAELPPTVAKRASMMAAMDQRKMDAFRATNSKATYALMGDKLASYFEFDRAGRSQFIGFLKAGQVFGFDEKPIKISNPLPASANNSRLSA